MVRGLSRPSSGSPPAPRQLIDARERFLASPDEALPGVVRDLVAQSWRRSLHFGVDPRGTAPLELDEDDLRAYREAHPLASLMPLVRHLLAEDADSAGHIVAVADAEGRLLWVEGHAGLRSHAEAMHFVEGALWSERGIGTNAPGTALALSAPVQISAAEHFGAEVRPWSCVASPVRNLLDGSVLGVVDLTGGHELAGPRSLALVRACAAAMETQLLVSAQQRGRVGQHAQPSSSEPGPHERRSERPRSGELPSAPFDGPLYGVTERPADPASERGPAYRARPPRRFVPTPTSRRFGWGPAAGRTGLTKASLDLLGRDSAVLHLPDRTVALSRRHTEIVWLLARSGSGLTVEALDAALHEHGSHLATIRSEMFRLRKALGGEVLASRPYRLLLDISSDFDSVRQLIARGAVLKALDLFRGAPLPGSEAPGVISARAELLAELRAAVIASRSVTSLERWTATAEGHDDLQAWQALLAALPYGSPKRAPAKTHLARLATSLQPPAIYSPLSGSTPSHIRRRQYP